MRLRNNTINSLDTVIKHDLCKEKVLVHKKPYGSSTFHHASIIVFLYQEVGKIKHFIK